MAFDLEKSFKRNTDIFNLKKLKSVHKIKNFTYALIRGGKHRSLIHLLFLYVSVSALRRVTSHVRSILLVHLGVAKSLG